MARKYVITDGTTEIDLLTIDQPGFMALRGGLGPNTVNVQAEYNLPPFGDGAVLANYRFPPAIENWQLNLLGNDHNQTAHMLQELFRLLVKAKNYHLTEWQTEPVWIQSKTTDERNMRYSLVYGMANTQLPDLFRVPFEAGAELAETLFTIVREPFWRSHQPEQLPTAISLNDVAGSPSTQADHKHQVIGNHRHDNVLTHLFMYDDSAAAFSSNLIAETSFPLFEVSSSTPAAGDIMYVGSTDGPWFNAVFNLAVGGNIGSLAFVVEYWDGDFWLTASNAALSDDRLGTGIGVGYTGSLLLKVSGENDWASTTINSVDAYWIRVRLTTATSWTTSPEQGGQVVYTANDTYIEFPATAIAGDESALSQIRLFNSMHINNATISWIMLGLKTRGLGTFTSRLNFGGQNPTGWTANYETDTSKAADPQAPGGNMALCTFSGTITIAERGTFDLSSENEDDWEGTYRVFLRCKQVGGSAGDVSVQLKISRSVVIEGEIIPLQFVDQEEVVDLGIFSINPYGLKGDEVAFGLFGATFPLSFNLLAKASSSTPDLELYDLVIMPIDEWAVIMTETGLANQHLSKREFGVIDGGVQRFGAFEFSELPSDASQIFPLSEWETRGRLPFLPPNVRGQIHVFPVAKIFQGTWFKSPSGLALGVELYTHERWFSLRGAD